jgi:Family of unknown function (DUF6263)
MKKITVFISAAILTSASLFAQNNSVNLKKGNKYSVESKVTTHSSTEMQGQTMEANIDASTSYNIEVNNVEGNNYNLTNTVSGVKMNMSQMGQQMSFDSDKPEDLDGPIGSALKPVIKKPMNVVIDKSGKIVQQKKEADDSSNDASALISRQLGDFEATGYGAEMAFESLPKNLKAGTTWSNKTDNNGISKTTNYTVKSIAGNLATIALDGTIASDTKMEMQGMEITTKTTGKFTGEEIVDINTGVIQSNSQNIYASGTVGVMGQQLPTTSKVTSVTTVKSI